MTFLSITKKPDNFTCQIFYIYLKKDKIKTIYVYFIKQMLFGYSPSSVLLKRNEILLLTSFHEV